MSRIRIRNSIRGSRRDQWRKVVRENTIIRQGRHSLTELTALLSPNVRTGASDSQQRVERARSTNGNRRLVAALIADVRPSHRHVDRAQ